MKLELRQKIFHISICSFVSLIIATIGAAVSAVSVLYISAHIFDYLYPHDGHSSLGAFALALLAFPLAWVGLLPLTYIVMHRWLSKRQAKATHLNND